MGVVYLAERADGQFEQQVVVKLIKRGMDSDAILQRFLRERQILARLQHPNIARLLDAGAAPDGRPFIAMEFVEGEPITDFVAQKDLPLEERLLLFGQVCEAVAYAHRRLIVHRDLKPSNILVAEDDAGQAQVKLLDFGIARLLDADEDGSPTRTGMRPVTPAYAAPEQMRGEPVTTAADIFALGVVLFEMLTGQRPPHPIKPPSILGGDERLRRGVRGDLDTIVLKALREDADERYPTVESLLDDLLRRRTGLPIHAHLATRWYRTKKFVQRHRIGMSFTVSFAVLLVTAIVLLALQQRQTVLERNRAEDAAMEAEGSASFLESLFDDTNPSKNVGDTLSAVDLLDRGRRRADDELAGTPSLHARMLRTIGIAFRRLEDYPSARDALEAAYALQLDRLGPDDPESLDLQSKIASTAYLMGDRDSARRLYDDWVARVQDLPDDGTVVYAHQAGALGEILLSRRQYGNAIVVLERAVDIYRENGAMNEGRAQIALGLIVDINIAQDAFDSAEPRQRELLQLLELRGDPPMQAIAQLDLARIIHGRGRYREAQGACVESLRQFEQMDPGSSEFGKALFECGDMLREQGDINGAERLLDRSESILANHVEANPWLTARISMGQAEILIHREAFAEAEALLLTRHRTLIENRDPDDPLVQNVLREIVKMYERHTRMEELSRFQAMVIEGSEESSSHSY